MLAGERLWRGRGVGGAHGRGAGGGPRQGMGSGFFGEFNQAAPCGVSLSGVPADPGRAFQRFPAVPHGTSLSPLRRLPALRSGEGGGGTGRWGVRGGFGGRGVAGSRAAERVRCGMGVGGAHGRGAGGGPRHGKDSGFFAGNSTKLRLPAHSCCSTGTSMPRHSALPWSSVRGRWRGIRGSFGDRGVAGLRA